jgi:diguanylate cyclase (GGDEF)-like protein
MMSAKAPKTGASSVAKPAGAKAAETAAKAVKPAVLSPAKPVAKAGKPRPEKRKAEKQKPEKQKKGRKLGLVGRIALIALSTSVAATVFALSVTPLLVRRQFDTGRLVYAAGASQQLALIVHDPMVSGDMARVDELTNAMSGPLPGGRAVVFNMDGKVLVASKHAGDLATADKVRDMAWQPQGGVLTLGDELVGVAPVLNRDGKRIGTAVLGMTPRTLWDTWSRVAVVTAIAFLMALIVFGFFLLPIARRALVPVTRLEAQIRKRDVKDKSKLADSSDDRVLKPLLTAIDEVHERSEAQMRRALALAYADPVTRLPNRLRFLSKLEMLVDKGQGPGSCYLAVCDINAFRKLNVAHGPRIADMILSAVAERMRALASQSKGMQLFIGRIGADQFGIIAPGAEQETVSAYLAELERTIAEPMTIEGMPIRITASFGAANAPRDAASAGDLLKQAEIALKEAKHQPAVRRAFYDDRIQQKAIAQQRLENEIREGLERGEFVAVYQPKVNLESGELVGAEALARWRRPDGAVVSPGRFVPICEELGLISRLGESVMRDACNAAAGWNRKGAKLRIAVNVSPQQFDEPDFIQKVQQALDESGLSPDLLELEITESAAVSDPDRVARTMWPLRNRGVRLAIDDFGTGHSNFASITRLPFDVFKIDQQFIRALNTDPHAPAIVEMILAMAEALGQETVAEGVETREQADFLVRRNCTIGQGYYYSPPLPADEFNMVVRSWRPRPATKYAA